MNIHLQERHPNWELTVPEQKRNDFLAKILISDSEELHLGISKSIAAPMMEDPPSLIEYGARGQKRVLISPPGTPRRPRRMRMSHTNALPPETSHSTAESIQSDVFLA